MPWLRFSLILLTLALAAPIGAAGALSSVARADGPSSVARADGPPTLLVSRQFMERQGLAVGDVVFLSSDPSGAKAQPFRIVGIYEPTPDPMRLGSRRLDAPAPAGPARADRQSNRSAVS